MGMVIFLLKGYLIKLHELSGISNKFVMFSAWVFIQNKVTGFNGW